VVGSEDGRLYWVRPNGLLDFTPATLPFATNVAQGRVVGGGVVLSESSFIVTDYEGQFWRFDLDEDDRVRSTVRVGTIPLGDSALPRDSFLFRARWMTRVSPLIYWLDLSGRVGWLNHETGTSTVVHDFGWRPSFQYGGVAYAPDRDEVVAASVQSSALFRLQFGVFRLDSGFDQTESLGCATYHPSLGWFLGTANSGLVHHERSDGAWTSCNSQLGNGIGAIVPFRDGFIAGTTQGFIEQYSARDGWCEKIQPASNSIRFMVPYDADERRYVVTGPKIEERMQLYSTVTILEVNPQGDCDSIRNPGNEPRPNCALVAPP
jgi:hypothetical protein